MVDVADRLGVVLGTESFDLVERQVRAGGNHQVVVAQRTAIEEFDLFLFRMQPLGALRVEPDIAFAHDRLEIDADLVAIAPADGDPGIGWNEGILCPLVDHRYLVLGAQKVAQLIGHDGAAQAGTEYNDV